MSSKAEIETIEAELRPLQSALKSLTDSRLREVIETRIKICRTRLRQLTGQSSKES
jgi:hypothetical protein